MLKVSAALTLERQSPPAAAVGMNLPAGKCLLQRLAVHPCHHQDLAIFDILHNGRNQPGRVKLQLIDLINLRFHDSVFGHWRANVKSPFLTDALPLSKSALCPKKQSLMSTLNPSGS